MSRLADKRYSDPDYQYFRGLLEGWWLCGGQQSLTRDYGITDKTFHKWMLGTVAPPIEVRDNVIAWIERRVR